MTAAALLALAHLTIWHTYSGGEERALDAAVQRWNAQPGRPPVRAVGQPYDSFGDKLKAAIPRGQGPDLFIEAHDLLGEWSRYGLMQPLDGLVSQDVLDGLLPQTVAPLRTRGPDGREHLWGVPLAFKGLALFYRRDLVPAPPKTTDELLALCARFRAERRPGLAARYGFAYEAGAMFYHGAWLHGFGGSLYPDGAALPRLLSEEGVRALEFVAGMVRRQDIPDEMTSVLVTQFFNEGRAAVVMSAPWFLGQIEPGVPFGVAPLPRVSATGRPASGFTTIEAAFLNPQGGQKQAAADFAAFLAGPEAARLRALQGRQPVSSAATWREPEIAQDRVLGAFYAQLADMVPTDSRPETAQVWEPGNQALRQVLRGALAPRPALQAAQRQLDVYLRSLPPPASERPYGVLLCGLGLLLAAGLVLRLRDGRVAARAWRERGAYGYLAPAALAMGLLVFIPFAVGAAMSLFVVDPEGRWRFVGTANFLDILLCRSTAIFDPLSFYYTLPVTVLWTVLNVALHVMIGGGLALLLRDPLLRLRGVYRMLLLLPWAVPSYITALIWKGMFNRQFGAINGILVWLHLQPVSWFSRFWTALAANVATNVWLGFPFMMVITLGALSQIPREVEEAAVLDGATRWQRLRYVILPLLGPALLPSVLLGAVWTFNMFNVVFLVSGGEPDGATEILVSQAYRWAFTRGHRYGYAAAYAVLIFIVLIFQSALMRRVSDPRARRG